jgi:predicted Co/Zn/Cd cation transporter (cation efflux family)
MLVKIMIVYFCVYVEMCKLNRQHANKLVVTEMEFWKKSAIMSRKEGVLKWHS